MRKFALFFIFGCFAFISGCATTPSRQAGIDSLERDLSVLQRKFELAKKENYRLKDELTLFRRSRNIDSQKFIEAADILAVALQKDITEKNVWLAFTERGLVVSVTAEKLFVSGSASLSDEGKEFLDRFQKVLEEEFPNNYIYIEGHTDNQSLAVFEWKTDWDFSFARALNVLRYFTENKKMDALRFSAAGFGQHRPIASNETKEGRRLNRRIEIIIAPQQIKTEKL